MSNTVEELQTRIKEIESSITEEMSKEELYDKLVIAYHHLKDIIELQAPDVPLTVDKGLEAALNDSEEALAEASNKASGLQVKLDAILKIMQ